MLYNKTEFPNYVKTAGKITVATALSGLLIFMVAFMFDVGSRELSKVSAQTASTTLTVLNTPPSFTLNAYEVPDSSTSTPTNSGDTISWSAIGSDSNGAPYFLLVCSTNATPTANAAADIGSLGTAPPSCSPTSTVQWGVSLPTPSGSLATVATTTTENAPFATTTTNDWYAWVCDDDPEFPACNLLPVQGPTSTTASSSPFHVNSRPKLTNFYNSGPFEPGADTDVNFLSTSSDPDLVGGEDEIYLVVCQSLGWATSTNTCFNSDDFLASTTIGVTENATSGFAIPLPLQDDVYPAYAYIYDEHGHEALANGFNADYIISNAAPYVSNADISLNGGDDLILTNPGGQTTGFTLDLKVKDYNGCLTAASTTDEIKGFYASVFRNGTTSCDALASTNDPNSCYTNAFASSSAWTVPTTTWALSCVATSVCSSPTQDYMDYSCTFPLWFVAEPTLDTGTSTLPAYLAADYWTAGIQGFDNNYATGTRATSSSYVELYPLTALDVLSESIAYGSLKPGENNPMLSATSTVISIGNTGIDNEVKGDSMCDSYTPSTPCENSLTATIPESEQQFSASSVAYDAIGPVDLPNIALSSTTYNEVELDILKPTSTLIVNAPSGTTYWGIRVPGSITKSGSYTGMNTFTAVTAEPADWF